MYGVWCVYGVCVYGVCGVYGMWCVYGVWCVWYVVCVYGVCGVYGMWCVYGVCGVYGMWCVCLWCVVCVCVCERYQLSLLSNRPCYPFECFPLLFSFIRADFFPKDLLRMRPYLTLVPHDQPDVILTNLPNRNPAQNVVLSVSHYPLVSFLVAPSPWLSNLVIAKVQFCYCEPVRRPHVEM